MGWRALKKLALYFSTGVLLTRKCLMIRGQKNVEFGVRKIPLYPIYYLIIIL